MLTHLRISGFAILDDVELDLGPGLTVLTGETGAGKSLLVDAVALVRGARASAEVVRAGSEEARIEAQFATPEGSAGRALAERMAAAGVDPVEEGLVVRRVIGRNGRGRVYINGALSTAATLVDLVGGLIDLAGQHEHQTLVDPARHLAILDAHADAKLRALVEKMAGACERVRAAAAGLAAASLDDRTRAEREDFLRFQIQELDEAELQPREDETLKVERERLRAAEKLHAAARRAEESLYGRERSIVEELASLGTELGDAGRSDPSLTRLGAQLDEARVSLEDAADALRRYADGMHADPERLAAVDERMHLVTRIARKHGGTVELALARQASLAEELEALGAHEARRSAAEADLARARAEAGALATELSRARRAVAKSLGAGVSAAVQELGMSGARLAVEVSDRAAREGDDPALVFDGKKLTPAGWDRVEFLLAANLGEEPRPLARVASGGELSRVMLALKRVLVRADTVASYVFDEVDAGIGGPVADVVGRVLKAVSVDKQVLCVTHLPQIAAYGDSHFHVEKRTANGRTSTVVRRLGGSERVEELARMVGGAKVTAKARAHAEDLLKAAAPR